MFLFKETNHTTNLRKQVKANKGKGLKRLRLHDCVALGDLFLIAPFTFSFLSYLIYAQGEGRLFEY